MPKSIKIGDLVMIEQAWEDTRGYYHDLTAVVSRILPDGSLKFRIGYKKQTSAEKKLQAIINKSDWQPNEVTKL